MYHLYLRPHVGSDVIPNVLSNIETNVGNKNKLAAKISLVVNFLVALAIASSSL